MLTIDQINLAFVNYPFYIGMVTMATVHHDAPKSTASDSFSLGHAFLDDLHQ
jgi:hypothetical protein